MEGHLSYWPHLGVQARSPITHLQLLYAQTARQDSSDHYDQHDYSLTKKEIKSTTTMSETFQELADLPKEFVKDGMLFMNRCTKRTSFQYPYQPYSSGSHILLWEYSLPSVLLDWFRHY